MKVTMLQIEKKAESIHPQLCKQKINVQMHP